MQRTDHLRRLGDAGHCGHKLRNRILLVLNSPVLESPSLLYRSRHSAPSTCFNSSALDASDRLKLDQSPLGTSTQPVHPPGGFLLPSFADDHGPQN